MKNIVLLILSILIGTSAFAVEAEGYYIVKNGDTIKGKIEIPILRKLRIGGSSQSLSNPFKLEANESKDIDFTRLAFDFKFSENGEKFKKIDRLNVKGFGFVYEGQYYDFETWDVNANKQIYLMSALGDVAPNGVYFILRSINGTLPIYSLFQDVETKRSQFGNEPDYGNSIKRDIIFKHPTKGFIYISNQYPLMMKFSAALKYLEFEEEFVSTLSKKDNLLEVVKKYNEWKSSK